MNKKFLFMSIVFIILFVSITKADLPPAYYKDFYIKLDDKPISDEIFYAKLIYLDESDYPKNTTWEKCQLSECRFTFFFNYPNREEFRLTIYLPSSDKTYISDLLEYKNSDSKYEAELIYDGTIEIKELWYLEPQLLSFASKFAISLILTVFIELILGIIYIGLNKVNFNKYKPYRTNILRSILLANLISLPIVWFVFPFILTGAEGILIAEFFVIVIEGFIIKKFNKNLFDFRKSLELSLIFNVISFILGNFIFMMIIFY
ncbi:MAG: hypothetical protein JSV92_05045 [archaeon]|nr:MAG: hypothetical protein JSV92_05045 [archaeon]